MLQGQDMDGGIFCQLLPSTPWSPFHVAEVTSASCGGRGALLAHVAGGSLGEQGRPGGYPASRCLLRLWRQGPKSVLLPVQLLAGARHSPGCSSGLRGAGRHTCAHLRSRVCTPCSFRCPVLAGHPRPGQSLPVHHLLSACTCLCVFSYACTHASSPGQPRLSTCV